MITMRRQLLGLGFVAASSLLALNSANALSGPTAITFDGGPLGQLSLSGGVDGYAYFNSGTSNTGSLFGDTSNGAYVGSALTELQKTTGELQFTIEIGSNGGTGSLGTPHGQTSINTFSTGPLYAGYITIAPTGTPGFTVSGGQLGSLEGWESGVDWNNANQLTTEIFYVQNSQARGVEASYTTGPFAGTVEFGDGYDSGVWNYIQFLGTYTIDSTNAVSIYGAANLGTTGVNAQTFVGTGPSAALYSNSNLIGAFYNFTMGNLNIVPEVQYQYTKARASIGLSKAASNFGAAVFTDYSFGTSPYSVGAWIEGFTSHTSNQDAANYFIGPDAEGMGISVTPTWQYKYLFARADVGGLYLLRNKFTNSAGVSTTYGYGNYGTGKAVFQGTLEAGLLF
jgi:hypothetical protein